MRFFRLSLLFLSFSVAITLPSQAQSNFKQNCITNGVNNATLIVDQAISPTLEGNESLAVGDTLFAYTNDGLCAGYEAWTGNDDVSLVVAGPNAATDDADQQGYEVGETLKIKIFDTSEKQVTDYKENITYTSCSEVEIAICQDVGTYQPDVVYVVEGLSNSALPVELATFEVLKSGKSATLKWQTTSETGNLGFNVQHRTESAGSWSSLGFVEGAGTTSTPQTYEYQVDDLDYGTHQFRLTQVDQDGSTSRSRTVDVEMMLNSAYKISKVRPNPVRQTGSLDLTVKKDQQVTVHVYDLLGRRQKVVLKKSLPAEQTQTVNLNASQLPSGQYFLQIKGENFQATRRLTVVK